MHVELVFSEIFYSLKEKPTDEYKETIISLIIAMFPAIDANYESQTEKLLKDHTLMRLFSKAPEQE